MTCEDHHLGMNYVQEKPGKEPEMLSWCFTCNGRPRVPTPPAPPMRSVETEPSAKATATKRTPRSKNGVRSC